MKLVVRNKEEMDELAFLVVNRFKERKIDYELIKRCEHIASLYEIEIRHTPKTLHFQDKQFIAIVIESFYASVSFLDLDYSNDGMCHKRIDYTVPDGAGLQHVANEILAVFELTTLFVSNLRTRTTHPDEAYLNYILTRLVRADGALFREIAYNCAMGSFPTREVILSIARMKSREEEIRLMISGADAAVELIK